jgi:hypothetical protein
VRTSLVGRGFQCSAWKLVELTAGRIIENCRSRKREVSTVENRAYRLLSGRATVHEINLRFGDFALVEYPQLGSVTRKPVYRYLSYVWRESYSECLTWPVYNS